MGGGFPPFKASLIAEQISMSTNVKAFRYVYYRDIPDYLDMGWMADIPPDFARLNWYRIVMVWLCECKITGGSHDKRQMAGGPGLTPAIFERGPSSEIAIAIIE